MVYVNTSDDRLDRFKFTTGSLTRKWHVTLRAVGQAGRPLPGVEVWLDTEGDEHDEKGLTDDKGIYRGEVAEYVRDGSGQHALVYNISVAEPGATPNVVRTGWHPKGNVTGRYTAGLKKLELSRED